MRIYSNLLTLFFLIVSFPPFFSGAPYLKFGLQLIIIIVFLNTKSLNNLLRDEKNLFFDFAIYFYIAGISIGGLFNLQFQTSLIYSILYFFRFYFYKELLKKINLINIFDSLVIGFNFSALIGLFFDRNSQFLLIKLLNPNTNVASNRLYLLGSHPNYLGISAGLIIIYLLIRIINEQFSNEVIDFEKNKFCKFNSLLGYIFLILDLFLLYACNTRSAYLAIFCALLPVFIRVIKNFYNIYNKYKIFYYLFVGLLIGNFTKLQSFINRNITLFEDKYRGASTGLTGRIDIWIDILEKIGPIGFGYGRNVLGEKLLIIDSQWLFSSYIAGIVFTFPLFLFLIYFVVKAFFNIFNISNNIFSQLEAEITFGVGIFILIQTFLDQQTFGLTSPISTIFIMLPKLTLDISKKNELNYKNL